MSKRNRDDAIMWDHDPKQEYTDDLPLTPEQKSFAEEHHRLLTGFMARYGLSPDSYDQLALRYLQVVVRYTTDPDLRQYAFSTILWRNLRSELSNILRDRRQLPVPIRTEPPDDYEPPLNETITAELWQKIEKELTFKQCEAVLLRNQGYKNREIAELCGVRPKAIEKRFGRIRKILKSKEL